MATGKYRAQILLEHEQHQTLAKIAMEEDRSLSDLIRQIVGDWLAYRNEGWVWDQRKNAIERLKLIREHANETYGTFQGDLVADSRDERDQDLGNLWRGEA